ncbi:GNAT family N-acetyltransferase [Pseudofrankia sp. BMG5.37]|uniref:GNAT family N-acetyltransferase n=1 Tax=Pseudofrankia sp. BMG5.37 TaxID=3050035 RepID=UPI0028945250|nr:GNAT family N-acetyltransferase [Pseudofrankia sp. BMG5.37]MDT3441630.1 GNAT family N-acetyltransferase [Pseudofrankia sp. BMG5.37]
MTEVGLRPATSGDSEFCFALHRDAMGRYVEQIWGWDDALQRAHHERTFDPARTQIITVDGHDAGSISVERRPTETYLGRIEIHPGYQGQGIGSRLIQSLLDEAARRGHPVTLDVQAVNQQAHALYRRLGFHDVARHGQNNIKTRMSSARPREESSSVAARRPDRNRSRG